MSSADFPIVGIGASEGAVEALEGGRGTVEGMRCVVCGGTGKVLQGIGGG